MPNDKSRIVSEGLVPLNRTDLIHATEREWLDVLDAAARIGADDARNSRTTRTGGELVAMLATRFRNGHRNHLRSAYMAGRFFVASAKETVSEYLSIMKGVRHGG